MERRTWTDERLDDLNVKVDRIDTRMDRLVEGRMDSGFRELRSELAALSRMMFGTMLIGFLGVIATIIAHG